MGACAARSKKCPRRADEDTVTELAETSVVDSFQGENDASELRMLASENTMQTMQSSPIHRRASRYSMCATQSISFRERGEIKALAHEKGMQEFWTRLRGDGNAEDEFRVLRQSVFTGRWTLFTAGGVAKKPNQYDGESLKIMAENHPVHNDHCPFCAGNEHKTPDPLVSMDSQGRLCEGPELPKDWRVRCIPNIFPLLVAPPHGYEPSYEEAFSSKMANLPHSPTSRGVHNNELVSFCHTKCSQTKNQMDAVGYSEVIIEDQRHNGLLAIVCAEQVALSLRTLQARGKYICAKEGVRQVLYFKQWGEHSGGSLVHPHMQAVSLPIVTPALENRVMRARDFYEKEGECSVCQCKIKEILDEKSPAHSRHVHGTEHFLCVVPYSAGQYRVSLVPRRHHHSWLDATQEEVEDLAYLLQLVMETMYHLLDDPSYNIYIVTVDQKRTLREQKAPEEAFHWFVEVYPRFPADTGGVEMASGIRVVGGLPEDCAVVLKRAVEERLKERELQKSDEIGIGAIGESPLLS